TVTRHKSDVPCALSIAIHMPLRRASTWAFPSTLAIHAVKWPVSRSRLGVAGMVSQTRYSSRSMSAYGSTFAGASASPRTFGVRFPRQLALIAAQAHTTNIHRIHCITHLDWL